MSFDVPRHLERGDLPPLDQHHVMVFLEPCDRQEAEVDQDVDAYAESEEELA